MAFRRGNVDAAKKHLIQAGETKGSPQFNSFGPNMVLAKQLLEKGETETVLEYFDWCKVFREMDYGALEKWKAEIKNNKIPDFGANLYY